MPFFRKKPVVIEAERVAERIRIPAENTLHGHDLFAEPGDWIIKGVQKELYPCKDDIFRETYEPVNHLAVHAMVAPNPADDDEPVILPFPVKP